MYALVVCSVLVLASYAEDDLEKLRSLEGRVGTLTRERAELRAEMEHLQRELYDVTSARDEDTVTAFTAYITEDRAAVSGGIFVFDKELLDTDNAYDTSFGFFQCPVSGVYAFSLVIETPPAPSPAGRLCVVMDGQTPTDSMCAYTYTFDNVDSSGSHHAYFAVQCDVGGQVYAVAEPVGEENVITINAGSMFSGILVN